ncbi:transposase [Streptomyces sp. NPDC093097]|uniref:transposase n=1 Tax=Streptomyces sp. NPDC093097 TaxID=3366027 RepID=UPI00382724EC
MHLPGTLDSWVSRWRRNGSASSGRPATTAAEGCRLRGAERAELERLWREMSEKKRRTSAIQEMGMERDVLNRCTAWWVK